MTSSVPAVAPAPLDEALALLALARAPGVGPLRAAALLRAFGSAAAAVEAGVRGAWPGLPRWSCQRARAAGRAVDLGAAERELWRGRRVGARLVTLADADYPAPWRPEEGWPLALWVRGAWPTAVAGPVPLAVAIVGPRRASPDAQRFARELALAACRAGAWVVSGMAYGVDAAAHQGAIDAARAGAGASTLAVLAGGVDRVHPAAHRDLARAVLDAGGGIVAAAPIGAVPATGAFPVRNRWIAGLASVVAVVEAGPRSGALHTAAAALELGREVRTTPARPWDAHAGGSLALLRDGAAPLLEPDDAWLGLPAGVRPGAPPRRPAPAAPPAPWDAVLGVAPIDVDGAIAATGRDVGSVVAALEAGVLAGWAARLPDGRYRRA
ncbi:MAG: DNA-processing protein DprA [Trueperaceae bacterium]